MHEENKPENNSEDTKEAILNAARDLFAEKGFSDVSVSKIANEVGVAKSLIYYYFKDKNEILNALVDIFIADVTAFGVKNFKNPDTCEASEDFIAAHIKMKQEQPDGAESDLLEQGYLLMQQHKAIIKILFMETLKSNEQGNLLFELLDRFIRMSDSAEAKGAYLKLKEEEETRFVLFFFYLLPKITFHCLIEQWSGYEKVNPARLQKLFFELSMEAERKVFDKVLERVVEKNTRVKEK
jgi:AcrR family transcriptional regulator